MQFPGMAPENFVGGSAHICANSIFGDANFFFLVTPIFSPVGGGMHPPYPSPRMMDGWMSWGFTSYSFALDRLIRTGPVTLVMRWCALVAWWHNHSTQTPPDRDSNPGPLGWKLSMPHKTANIFYWNLGSFLSRLANKIDLVNFFFFYQPLKGRNEVKCGTAGIDALPYNFDPNWATVNLKTYSEYQEYFLSTDIKIISVALFVQKISY